MNSKLLLITLSLFALAACDSEKTPTSAPADTKQSTIAPVPVSEPSNIPAASPETSTGTSTTTTTTTSTEVVKADSIPSPLSGEQVYQKACINCHKTGVANAPKLGDSNAWAARISKGKDALYQSAKQGVPGTAMMARGTCGSCSDIELESAVDYMVKQSQ